MGEPNVLGMLIGGSFASGEADVYSDLDMQLVVEDEAVEATSVGRAARAIVLGALEAGLDWNPSEPSS